MNPNGSLDLYERNELAAGPRLGGLFNGPKTDTSAIWTGRPPILSSGIGPMTLSIAARNAAPADPGSTVLVEAECGNSWGGKTRRQFAVGGGLSAELRVGNFAHVDVRVLSSQPGVAYQGIPEGMTVFFSWTFDLVGRSSLWHFMDYPVGAIGTVVEAPEGAEFVTAEVACLLTWALPQFGTTFTQAVAPGVQIPVVWGAFSCNVANRFVFQLRGL